MHAKYYALTYCTRTFVQTIISINSWKSHKGSKTQSLTIPPLHMGAFVAEGNVPSMAQLKKAQGNRIGCGSSGKASYSEKPTPNHPPQNQKVRNQHDIDFGLLLWCGPGSNRRHIDFQSIALPTELPHHFLFHRQNHSATNWECKCTPSVVISKHSQNLFLLPANPPWKLPVVPSSKHSPDVPALQKAKFPASA